MLNWTSSTEISSTGRTDAYSIGASDGSRKIRRPGFGTSLCLWRSSEERSEAPDELTVSREASVHPTYCVPETLSSVQQPSFQHRMNRCPVGASVGAMTSARCNGYMKIKCHRKFRRHSNRFIRWSLKLLQRCQRCQRLLQSAE